MGIAVFRGDAAATEAINPGTPIEIRQFELNDSTMEQKPQGMIGEGLMAASPHSKQESDLAPTPNRKNRKSREQRKAKKK